MRPVEKWNPTIDSRIQATYADYHTAKPALCENLGTICSYCEKAYSDPRDLHVEHIQPKRLKNEDNEFIYAHLETAWSNFLLSCATCNGADNKGTQNVEYGHCHLPHLNNTYLSLCYKAGGVVQVNPSLTGQSAQNAQALLELVGLDKGPRSSKPGDKRWEVRSKIWNLAQRYLAKYKDNRIDLETIIDLVKGHGGWSIWFTLFKDYDEVKRALIYEFPGTAHSCFDEHNHYAPIPRHPKHTADPI